MKEGSFCPYRLRSLLCVCCLKGKNMKRQLTAMVTAFALVFTSVVATPIKARSNEDDLLKLLLGAAAVAIIIHELNDPKPVPHSYRGRKVIPDECLMDVRVNGRRMEVVSGRCVRRAGISRPLPSDCAFDIRTDHGRRTVYGQKCLRSHGWRIQRVAYEDSRYDERRHHNSYDDDGYYYAYPAYGRYDD